MKSVLLNNYKLFLVKTTGCKSVPCLRTTQKVPCFPDLPWRNTLESSSPHPNLYPSTDFKGDEWVTQQGRIQACYSCNTFYMSLIPFFLSNSSNSQLNFKCFIQLVLFFFFSFKTWEGYFSLPFCLYLHFQIVHIQPNHITLKVI